MSILVNKLAAVASSSNLVEIHRDRISRDALVGRILQISAHVILVERLDELHRRDGVAVVRVNDVTRIRTGTLAARMYRAAQLEHTGAE